MGFREGFWGTPLWRRKAVTASPEVLETWSNRRGSSFFPLIATPSRGIQARAAFERMTDGSYGFMYAHQPAVRAVVDFIASNVAQLALRCYERTSDIERHEVSDHPAAETMRGPNPQTPGQKFIFNMVRDHLVYGNAFALKSRVSPGNPLYLTQLPPNRTSVLGPSYFTVDAYRVYRVDGSHLDPDPPPEDILHWLGATDPEDPRLGLSPLETLRQVLAEDAASQAANVELFKAGLLKPGYIGRPLDAPPWSDQAATRFQEKWASSLKDSGRHTPILEEGMEFKDFGVSPKDAEMLSGRSFTRDEVSRQYGMVHCPPESEEERAQFLADVLAPLCEMFSAHLDLSILLTEFSERNHYFEFDLDEKLTGDERLKALTSASGAPVLTRNESRAMLNKPPKPGGDELVIPLNVIVGGKPSPAVMPIQDPNGPAQDGSQRNGNSSLNGHGKAVLLKRRQGQRERRNRYASEFTEELRKLFADIEKSERSKDLPGTFEPERWIKKLKDILLRLMRSVVEREGGIAAERLALAGFAMGTVQHYLESWAEGKAWEVITSAEADLSEPDVFTTAKDVWAPGIGDHLATKLTNFAHVEAGGMTPDASHRVKRWLVDELDVSAHPEMDGQVRRLTENFSNGKAYPPYEHPRCRCLVEIE